VNYVVVGAGVAGTVMALTLLDRGYSVWLADDPDGRAASDVAAGVINPVTGKRYVQSWRFKELYPRARQFFQYHEQQANQQFWYDMPILRALNSPLEVNEWAMRAAWPENEGLMSLTTDPGVWVRFLPNSEHWGVLNCAARVDFQGLRSYARTYFQRLDRWIDARLTVEDALTRFDRVICCEGISGTTNRFFPNLPWLPAKGERLLISIEGADDLTFEYMAKSKIMLVPLGNGRFWAGANYEWGYADDLPSDTGRTFVVHELDQWLKVPYRILDHAAGIRPVLTNRRPVLEWSTVDARVAMFNALGSKGALLSVLGAELEV
jgi:glycine oxidase